MIPRIILRSLTAYIEHGEPPDEHSCLRKILENDLAEAVGRADPETFSALKEIVVLLYTFAPGKCWGSPAALIHWLATDQEHRDRIALHGDWPDRPDEYKLPSESPKSAQSAEKSS